MKKFEHANQESSYSAGDLIMKENEARCDGEGAPGSAGKRLLQRKIRMDSLTPL